MEEFEPKKKVKIFTKEFYFKYSYVFIVAIVLFLGTSFGFTFFSENMNIARGSLTTAALNVTLTDTSINATGLTKPTDNQEGLSEFVKHITITNNNTTDAKVKLTLTRTSGLNLTDMSYALVVNGAIQVIDDLPSDGVILDTAILGNEVLNVEVRLWPKTTYTGSETTFVGELEEEIRYLGEKASNRNNLANAYVNFNCNGNTCETWRIVKVENERLVLTRDEDLEGASERTNSNKYNPNLTFNDNSMITSVSTDNKNVYLAKTVKLDGGDGSQSNPYKLINSVMREPDKKVIAAITYINGTEARVQYIYYNETNYISQVVDDPGFQGWTDGTDDYILGDEISFASDTTLTANFAIPGCVADVEFVQGEEYNDGTYTYRYMEEFDGGDWVEIDEDGWGVLLSNKESTNPVTTPSCISINGKPIVSMSYMFADSQAASINLNNFNTSNVTNMHAMFANVLVSDLNMSSFDTSNVTDMSEMFHDSYELTTVYVSNLWSIESVESDSSMFNGCDSLIGGNGTSYENTEVNDSSYARIDNPDSGEPGYFTDSSELTTIKYCTFNGELTEGAVYTDETYTYHYMEQYDGYSWYWSGYNGWGVTLTDKNSTSPVTTLPCTMINGKPVISMSHMFYNSQATSINLSGINTRYVTDMSYMFYGSQATSLDLSSFNTSNVNNMGRMFYNSQATSLNLSSFNTSNVTDMSQMFQDSYELTTVYVSNLWSTESVEYDSDMFTGCGRLVGGNGTSYENEVTNDSSYARIDNPNSGEPGYFTDIIDLATIKHCTFNGELTEGAVYTDEAYTYHYKEKYDGYSWYWLSSGENGWGVTLTDKNSTSPVTALPCTMINEKPVISMSYMFADSQATSINLSGINTKYVTDMSSMFRDSQATSLDLSSFNTSNVTDMSGMFYNNQATSLNLSSFNTSNVINMNEMFANSQATSLNLSSFNTSNVTEMGDMFGGSQATSINLSSFDTSHVTHMTGMFSLIQATSLDLSSFNTSNVIDMNGMFQGSYELTTVYVSNLWSIESVEYGNSMFMDCHNLVGGAGTSYANTGVDDSSYARIDNPNNGEPGYFTFRAHNP